MTWLLTNWRIVAIGMAVLGTFYAGWHSHTIYDGYIDEKASNETISSLGKGLTNIVDFNQDFEKAKTDVKDDCINSAIPDSIRGLLH